MRVQSLRARRSTSAIVRLATREQAEVHDDLVAIATRTADECDRRVHTG
jgi:hypothetical protein